MKCRYDFFFININFAIISVSSISFSDKLPSFKKPLTSHFNHPNSEYVDIDEGAIVKVEFSKTLSGMMSAMEEIQDRADNIMENIMVKEGELKEIQLQAEKAQKQKLELENFSNQMLDEKQLLELDIKNLILNKVSMEQTIKDQENEVVKTKFLLAPLTEKVTALESELNGLTKQISNKQEELNNLKMKIVESGANSVSVEDNAAISALAPVLGISLLFNLIVIISLILAFSSQQQSDSFRREESPVSPTYVDNVDTLKTGHKLTGVREPETWDMGPNINTDFSQYPLAVQEAISSLKSQYELEDGELESVIQNLWNEDSLGYSGGVMPPTSAAANVLSPEEPYITLPRSENFYNNYLNMYN